MKRTVAILLSAFMLLFLAASPFSMLAGEDDLIITPGENTYSSLLVNVNADMQLTKDSAIFEGISVATVEKISTLPGSDIYLVTLTEPSSSAVDEAIKLLKKAPGVLGAQPNYNYSFPEDVEAPKASLLTITEDRVTFSAPEGYACHYALIYSSSSDSVFDHVVKMENNTLVIPKNSEAFTDIYNIYLSNSAGDFMKNPITVSVSCAKKGDAVLVTDGTTSLYSWLRGDIDQNGSVGISDAVSSFLCLAGKKALTTEREIWSADFDASGSFSIVDTIQLFKAVAGKTA